MKTQSYSNHIRFYNPHHFVLYPLLLLLLGTAIYFIFSRETERTIWIFISIVLLLIFWLAFMLRQHYALTLQDRIVRLELHYRYFTLTGDRLELLENQLSDSQLFALRFAPDEEFPNLLKRALQENLSGQAIKKSIIDWKPDHHRV
ncbi:hypothetical protein ABH942_002897 [Flavobacterium sp. 28YEA47A]|uniref:DUF6526 family protein n=1 Tax=Flavobacterium sp. 28YEA47A TaxID=3156276 RepID=UPI0035141940